MNATGYSNALLESNLSSRPLPPTSAFAKLTAALRETVLVLEASLFWTLVLLISSLLWLGSVLLGTITTLIQPREPAIPSRTAGRDSMGAEISLTLILVLAVILASVGALAYGWCRAQEVKAHRAHFSARHHATYLPQPTVTP